MTDELFQVPPTPATPLQKARARLAKADSDLVIAELRRYEIGASYEAQLQNAKNELQSAKNSAQVEESRELERLKQQTK